jgi:hypothetical protein
MKKEKSKNKTSGSTPHPSFRATVRTFGKVSITKGNHNPPYRRELIEIYISQNNISTGKLRINKISK